MVFFFNFNNFSDPPRFQFFQSLFLKNLVRQNPNTVTTAPNNKHPPAPPLADKKAGLCARWKESNDLSVCFIGVFLAISTLIEGERVDRGGSLFSAFLWLRSSVG